MNKEEMTQLYEISIKRYNTLIDAINDTYTNLIYLEQFPVVVGSFVDNKKIDSVLEVGNRVNELEESLKDVKKTIKQVVNDCIEQYDEDLTETVDIQMSSRINFVGDTTTDKIEDINRCTEDKIQSALDFAKDCDAETAKKLAGYAAVMKVLINERNNDIEE